MNTGIIVGMVTVIVAILLNWLNLFCFKDFSTNKKDGIKIKHWRITYVISWVIAAIPFVGCIFELLWTFHMCMTDEYKCTSKLFEKV